MSVEGPYSNTGESSQEPGDFGITGLLMPKQSPCYLAGERDERERMREMEPP